ncbi:TAXI family TRAP transporter solute-binding subunit [Virgibacillus dokdonensis]|uniref:NMT1/THI5 like protein n=1 Tax=Virgibacillus dokdonensis TaxID=302167 RepID=A0A2K9IZG9_9BACI|nr:TAXI family TRAP transporter solute-binding subunit [Virgibacillus dokdonensis]AUJ25056.1 NMT1/THI5 like protein [Virgibacillus dokdonensis]
MQKYIFLIMVIIGLFYLAACSGGDKANNHSAASNGEAQAIVFGTGGTSGTYYPIGGALKPVFEESEFVINVTVESTGASVANVQNMQNGLNQMSIIMSDVGFDAIEGTGQFDGNSVDVQALAGMYQNVVQIVATTDSGIENVEDLEGKRVGVGKVGSGVEQSAQKVLEVLGLSYDNLSKVTHTGYADSVQEMKNGNLDAAFFTSGIPNSNITDLMQQNDVVFVEIKADIANTLMEKYPFYKSFTIPANDETMYNLAEEVTTVGIQNLIAVSPDLNEDIVYDLTKRYYDYLGSEEISIHALKYLERDQIATDLVVPLHPGAKKFYQEQGLVD